MGAASPITLSESTAASIGGAILPVLWQELQNPLKLTSKALSQLRCDAPRVGAMPVQINLTDNTLAEVVITVSSEAIAALTTQSLVIRKLRITINPDLVP